MSQDGRILLAKTGSLATVVLSNPTRRNAFTVDMHEAFTAILNELAADSDVRVVVLTGAGDKAFSAGADISKYDADRATPEAAARFEKAAGAAARTLVELAKPTIASIRGACLGVGLSVALNADIRIAAESAQFGFPIARLGIGYSYNGIKAIADAIGAAYTKEIFYTARLFSAAEALQMGLVNRVVPDAELDAYVADHVARIAEHAPLTLAAVKAVVGEAVKEPGARDEAIYLEALRRCAKSKDAIEGRAAFFEKRTPVFVGA